MRIPTRLRPIFSATFLKFAIVGASGVVVNLAALALFSALGMRSSFASALAIQVSILTNFVINDRWTFADRRTEHRWVSRAVRFQLISLVGAVVQWTVFIVGNVALLWMIEGAAGVDAWYATGEPSTFKALVHPIAHPPEVGKGIYLSQLAGIAVATGWNFFANLIWTWKSPSDAGSSTTEQ